MATDFAARADIVLSAEGLRVGRGDTVVLEGVDLEIRAGEIFGIVGQARSGKTALLETLIGLRAPLAGVVRLLGSTRPASLEIRQHVGSSLRPSTVERRTTVAEVLRLSASLYDHQTDVDALMRDVGLAKLQATYREQLAPHELARLSLAMGLVSDPKVLFADEPTRELDPGGRQDLWDVLRGRRDRGMAIVLSTNQMDEAERLCDRVAILGNRRVLAVDTPERLVSAGGSRGRMVLETTVPIPAEMLKGLAGVGDISREGSVVRVEITDPGPALQSVAGALVGAGLQVRSLRLAQATLEDRFVEMMRASQL
ncbi:MAG: ABC transporter ATP-binding protein [Acidobacteriota bacterium]